jgi:serine/threonine protein kinase
MASSLASSTPDIVQLSKLETRFRSNPDCTEHVKYVFENERSRKKVYKEERWTIKKVLGHGGFGVVTLEQCIQGDNKGGLRAVKKIRKLDNYQRELEAIALFSHEKVSLFTQWIIFVIEFQNHVNMFLSSSTRIVL